MQQSSDIALQNAAIMPLIQSSTFKEPPPAILFEEPPKWWPSTNPFYEMLVRRNFGVFLLSMKEGGLSVRVNTLDK